MYIGLVPRSLIMLLLLLFSLYWQQNIGQSMGPPGVDINVLPAWGRGYSGKGVVVAILDDGEWQADNPLDSGPAGTRITGYFL